MRNQLALLLTIMAISHAHAAEVVVEDIFGRRLNEHGLTLVDWEGPIANPAIKFYIVPPPDTAYPARAVLTSNEPRLYFNLPSSISARGPVKVVEFRKSEKLPVLVSIFPDREVVGRDLVLQLTFLDAQGNRQVLKLPCHVIDQDSKDPPAFPLTVDFSQDRTGLFQDEKKRQVVRQAAQDWAYFFEPGSLDPVPAGKEKTFIRDPDNFLKGQEVLNTEGYTGYLLYAYGIHTGELRSGGEPSRVGGLQSQKGKELPIRRSGGVEIETHGNFNSRGWLVSLAAGDFWRATNPADGENDLYSIAHHEIGHSLIFNAANPLFDEAKKRGKFEDAMLRAYLGSDPEIDPKDHLDGVVDPASRCGAFGNEFHGEMPRFRWQITKLDLLCARAIGYPLRATSALAPLHLQTEVLPGGAVGKEFAGQARAAGGVPFYHWEVTAGSLPDGLRLNSFSGAVSGIPVKDGLFEFTLRVRDYVEKAPGQSRTLRIEIRRDSATGAGGR